MIYSFLLKKYSFTVLLANSDDTKALFRRSQAYRELNKFDESLRDAKRLISIDPKNSQFISYIQGLTRLIQDKVSFFFIFIKNIYLILF